MKITERISTIMLVIMGAVLIGSVICHNTHIIHNNISDAPFITIMGDADGTVVYDGRTGVEYFKSAHSMTVLVDKDGKPMIYNEE